MTGTERREAWVPVLYLWGAFFLAYVGRQAIFSTFPLLRRQLGFSEVELGLTSTVFLWTYALANPVAGRLSDLFSKKRLIVLSVALTGLCTIMLGTAGSVRSVLAWRAILAVVQALYVPAAVALIAEWHSEASRSKAMSLHGTAQFTGVVVGGWYGGLAESLGWRWMLWMLAAAGLAYTAVLWTALRERSGGSASLRAAAAGAPRYRALLTLTFVAYCTVFVVICAMIWALYTWLPDLLRARFNLPLATAGWVGTVYFQAAMVAGLFCGAPAGDALAKRTRRGRLYVMVVGLALASPFFYLVARSDSLGRAKAAAVGFGLFLGLFNSNFLASLVEIVPENTRGFAVGFCNMLGALAGGVSAFAIGALKARLPVESLFQFGALAGVGAAALLLVVLWRFFPADYRRAHPELSGSAAPASG
ncbi:MAG: hypothetical protein DMG07_13360 [Acidobacteria bacterium]|nr:MAG: hypothetical protein DMG07_13360 [Acidobacteriota bacterium]